MYLISGMHRSGTSLIARFFLEAGADLGDADTFYRADRWNPDGYFEQPEIHAINMPLINGNWGKLAYFRLPSTDTILTRAQRLSDQIVRASEKYRHKVVKENRFCLTLPAWRAYGTEFDGVVICLRHPSEIVQSLRRRNWVTPAIGYQLWKTHLDRILEHTKDIPTRLVRYENVLDRQRVSGELCDAICGAGVACDPDLIGRLHGKLVRSGPAVAASHSATLPLPVARLWDDLLERHASQNRNI